MSVHETLQMVLSVFVQYVCLYICTLYMYNSDIVDVGMLQVNMVTIMSLYTINGDD